jgi:catechol 2,3-dioxygenase-like lactoylglutathione lyase family enzyme
MSDTQTRRETAIETPTARRVDMKLEVVVIPVSDVDRAKRFYGDLGWRLDADFAAGDDWRVIQFTPPGSECSVIFGKNVTAAAPGSAQGLYHGNGWLLQEVTARLPGRVDADDTTFASSTELATALRRAEAAHAEYEKRTGRQDANWPEWYAEYIVREQAGKHRGGNDSGHGRGRRRCRDYRLDLQPLPL